MKETIDLVKEFHQQFGHPIAEKLNVSNDAVNRLRLALLAEELGELRDALQAKDAVKVLDALTDLQYVLDGAFLAFGLHPVKAHAFQEVHRSNMSKLGRDGKPVRRADGKTLKGPNYSPPKLANLLSLYLNLNLI